MSQPLLNILPETPHISAADRVRRPYTLAVPLLNTDLARYYSYAHTVQMLAYYYLRAGALVEDPLTVMVQDMVPLAVSQCLFCAICLPSVGNWNSCTDAGEAFKKGVAKVGKGAAPPSGSQRKKLGAAGSKGATKATASSETSKDGGGSWPSRILPTVLSLVLAIIIPPVPLMVLALILGAPLYPTSLLPHTMALAVHVSLLGTLPIFYTHGVAAGAWKDVSAAWLPFDEAGVWSGTVGAVVGGWFGAIPIALDWDREWQKWPCTVLWGAVIGWAVGRGVTNVLRLGIGRRIDLSVTESTPPRSSGAHALEQKKNE